MFSVKNAVCHNCSSVGHLQVMCPNGKKVCHKGVNVVDSSDKDSEFDTYHCVNMVHSGYQVVVNVEVQKLCMQMDTGAAVTILPETVLETSFPDVKFEPPHVALKTYTGEHIPIKGKCDVTVTSGNQSVVTLPLIVVKDQGEKVPVLLGRNWPKRLKLDWKTVMSLSHVTVPDRVEALRAKFPTLFSTQLGGINKYEAKVVLKPDCTPGFCKPRPVLFAIELSRNQ